MSYLKAINHAKRRILFEPFPRHFCCLNRLQLSTITTSSILSTKYCQQFIVCISKELSDQKCFYNFGHFLKNCDQLQEMNGRKEEKKGKLFDAWIGRCTDAFVIMHFDNFTIFSCRSETAAALVTAAFVLFRYVSKICCVRELFSIWFAQHWLGFV